MALPITGPQDPDLTNALHPRRVLERYGLSPHKSLGQHFLVDLHTLQAIVRAADLHGGDTVLEIGPGLGSLTRILAGEAGRVVAVELDERLISVLHLELGELGNVELVHGDFLKCDVGGLVGEQYAVVSNLPYYITGAIIRRLLHRPPRPWRMVLTVQEEVAQRMLAKPGDMNLLAVSVQYFGRVFRVARVKAGSFYPRPDVDSAVVRFDLRDVPAAHVPDEALFFRVVTAGFRQKRKQLRNSLQAGLDLEASDVEALLLSVGIDPRRRAETLSLEDWGQVTWAVATSNPGRWMSAVTSD